jgi:YggT family protein
MSVLIGIALAAVTVLQLLLMSRVASSWILLLAGPRHRGIDRVEAVLERVTEPILAPVRRLIPPWRLGSAALDLSVPVVFVGLSVVARLLLTA